MLILENIEDPFLRPTTHPGKLSGALTIQDTAWTLGGVVTRDS